MRLARIVGAGVLGYFVGTFPTADLVARRVSGGTVDLRSAGTGNPGGANAAKVLGTRAGATVMVGDATKGALASGFGAMVAGPAGAHLAGSASVIGHCYPAWNGFRGGKGVAAGVGQCIATFPAYVPFNVGVAVLTTTNPRWKQRAFAATVLSSAAWVAGSVLWWRKQWPNLWGPRPTIGLPLATALSCSVIAYRFVSAVPLAVQPAATLTPAFATEPA